MSQKQPSLLERMRQGEKLTAAQQLELVVTLSIPAIMAQITSIVMQYIDCVYGRKPGRGRIGVHRTGVQQYLAVWWNYRGGGIWIFNTGRP